LIIEKLKLASSRAYRRQLPQLGKSGNSCGVIVESIARRRDWAGQGGKNKNPAVGGIFGAWFLNGSQPAV
jgi:hypothetical protein